MVAVRSPEKIARKTMMRAWTCVSRGDPTAMKSFMMAPPSPTHSSFFLRYILGPARSQSPHLKRIAQAAG
jgi:hypothetical protein